MSIRILSPLTLHRERDLDEAWAQMLKSPHRSLLTIGLESLGVVELEFLDGQT
jgi:hypothetical protein